MESLNLNSLNIGDDGRLSFSGLTSGIDFAAAVDAIIAARRIPANRLELEIAENTQEIAELQNLRTFMSSLRDSLSNLYGKVSVGNTADIFSAKSAFATTTRVDGATPAAAANILGISVTNDAVLGSHKVEVLRTAKAQKITSQTYASTTTALTLSGSFIVNGKTVTISVTDTLLDVRDRINNVNTGSNASKVTASIVSISSTEHRLVLTSDETGVDMAITDSGTVLSGLGISTTHGEGAFRSGMASSKVQVADGFVSIVFDGTQTDNSFLISYDQATKVMTLTKGDGTTDTATLSTTAIASGSTEIAKFTTFGVSITLDSAFIKTNDVTVAADAFGKTLGTGVIDPATIKISDTIGDISGITANTLTFTNLGTPANITITVGAFVATGVDLTGATGTKTVNLTDGTNTLQVQFDTTAAFVGDETAVTITLNELDNLVGANGNPFTTVLQVPVSARLTADGLIDIDRFETAFIATDTSPLSTFTGTLTITGNVGTDTVAYTDTTTLQDLRTAINAKTGSTGVTASIMTDESGFRLVLTNGNTTAITVTDTSGLKNAISLDNDQIIERTSNTINDLFAGITMTLFQAEEGTTINIDLDRDLTGVKADIQAFVDAYNTLKVFLNRQTFVDETTGEVTAETGILFSNRTVADIEQKLAAIVGAGTAGVDSGFSVLAQIGIDLIDNGTVTTQLENDTLVIDQTKLDEALLNNPDDVRKMFSFDFSSSNSEIALLSFNGLTTYSASGYTLNIGNFGDGEQSSNSVVSGTALLNDGVNSLGSNSTAGQLTINGITVDYDPTVDTLDTLNDKINNATIPGVTSFVADDGTGKFKLHLVATIDPLAVSETGAGNLLTAANLTAVSQLVGSANIDGAADGSNDFTTTTSNRTITAQSTTGAAGLVLRYNGNANVSDITLNFTVGVGAQMFFAIDHMLAPTNGAINTGITALEDQNTVKEARVTRIIERLAYQREQLLARFIAMETALARLNRISDSITQLTESLFNKK